MDATRLGRHSPEPGTTARDDRNAFMPAVSARAVPLPIVAPRHALALIAGALLPQQWAALPPLWIAVVALSGLVLLLWLRPRLRMLWLFGAGIALVSIHGSMAVEARWPSDRDGSSARVSGVVVGIPQRDALALRFDIDIDDARMGATVVAPPGLTRLAWFNAPDGARVFPGDRLTVEARLRAPRGTANRGAFDFERYAVERRIGATGHVVAIIARERAASPSIDALRAAVSGFIATERGDDTASALLRALSVGDQAALEAADWRVLRATGVTHLIAISGLHIGLVAGFGALLAGAAMRLVPRLGLSVPRRQVQALVALVFAIAYSLLAGMSIPVVRTLVMIGVVLVAVLLRRSLGPWSALALAALAVIGFDALAVLNPGFWLSFAGVAWLIFCLGERSREAWIATFGRAQLIAALGLLPISLALFQQASLVGPLANLVAVPWISFIVVPLTLIGTALVGPWPAAASVVFAVAEQLMAWLWSLLAWMSTWPGAELFFAAPDTLVVGLALAGAAVLLLPRAMPGRALGALLLLPLLLPRLEAPAQGRYAVDVLDVGHGLAVLVRTGTHALLFGSGAGRSGLADIERLVVPSLHGAGVARLDAVVLNTLPSEAMAVEAIAAAIDVTRRIAGRAASGIEQCIAGTSWEWDGVHFRFLHPPAHFPDLGGDSGCVLAIGDGEGQTLITGNAGDAVETMLIRREGTGLKSALLIAPNHGSQRASHGAFVRRVAPAVVAFSIGWNNRFGHPHPRVIDRYTWAGAQIVDTASGGQLRFVIDPALGIVESTAVRFDAARWWRVAVPPVAADRSKEADVSASGIAMTDGSGAANAD